MIEITKAVVNTVLPEIVAEHGRDYIYYAGPSGCVYVHNGEPSCLIGHFLHRLGVSLERLKAADESTDGGTSASDLLRQLQDEGVVDVESHRVIHALSVIQSEQDSEVCWGQASGLGIRLLNA